MSRSSEPLSAGTEEYLEAIYRLSASGPIEAGALARHLKVAPASVTGMLKRLAERTLIHYQRYRRVSLTPTGQRAARSLIRRHRLSERLCTDLLGMSWEEAHEAACKLEHVVVGALAERVAARLGGATTTCPHGHSLTVGKDVPTLGLDELPAPTRTKVIRVADEDRELLRYLAEIGLKPGAAVKVAAHEPFGGPVTIECGGRSRAIAREVAAKVRVRAPREPRRKR